MTTEPLRYHQRVLQLFRVRRSVAVLCFMCLFSCKAVAGTSARDVAQACGWAKPGSWQALHNQLPSDTDEPFIALIAPLTDTSTATKRGDGATSAGLGRSLAVGVCSAFNPTFTSSFGHAQVPMLVVLDDSVQDLPNECDAKAGEVCASQKWAKRVLQKKNAIAIIGSIDSSRTHSIQQEVLRSGRKNFVVLNAASTRTDLSDTSHPFFRLGLPDARIAEAVISYYGDLAEHKRVGVLSLVPPGNAGPTDANCKETKDTEGGADTQRWTSGLNSDLCKACAAQNCDYKTEVFDEHHLQTLAATVEKFSKGKALIAIGILAMYQDAASILKIVDHLTVDGERKIHLFGTTALSSYDFPASVKGAGQVDIFTAFGGEGATSPLAYAFRRKFHDAFNREPDTFHAQGYDAGLVTLHAYTHSIKQQDCSDLSEKLGHELETINVEGVLGRLEFGTDHQRPLQVAIRRWTSQHLLPYDWYQSVVRPNWVTALTSPVALGLLSLLLFLPGNITKATWAVLVALYGLVKSQLEPWVVQRAQSMNDESVNMAFDFLLGWCLGAAGGYICMIVVAAGILWLQPSVGRKWMRNRWRRLPIALLLRNANIRGLFFRRQRIAAAAHLERQQRHRGGAADPMKLATEHAALVRNWEELAFEHLLIEGPTDQSRSALLRRLVSNTKAPTLPVWCYDRERGLLEEVKAALGERFIDHEFSLWLLRRGYILLVLDAIDLRKLSSKDIDVIRSSARLVATRKFTKDHDSRFDELWCARLNCDEASRTEAAIAPS